MDNYMLIFQLRDIGANLWVYCQPMHSSECEEAKCINLNFVKCCVLKLRR